jgi:hypothetical protein
LFVSFQHFLDPFMGTAISCHSQSGSEELTTFNA